MRRGTLIKSFAGAALAVAVAVPVVLSLPAGADENPSVGPDPVTSLTADLTYGAVGRVPPLEPPLLTIPQFGGFGLSEEDQWWIDYEREQNARKMAAWQDIMKETRKRIKSMYPDAPVETARKKTPLFANWKVEGGSETVELGGRESKTSTEPGTSYNVTQGGDGKVVADYSAKATIQGTSTELTGKYTFELIGPGYATSYGTMGINSSTMLWQDGAKLKLGGYANITGADVFTASVGPTSYTVGMTATTKAGSQVGVSVAVGPNGELTAISVGGEVAVPGLPEPITYRVDISNQSVSFTGTPAPGVSVSQNTGGAFTLNVDINKFGSWFGKLVIGN